MKRSIYLFLSVMLLIFGILTGCSSNQSATGTTVQEGMKPQSEEKADQKTASNFPNKEVTIVVPYGPGGGFDTTARLIAPYLEKYLPKNARVVVKNVTGGEANIGLGQVYKAKPDGHTIAILNIPGNTIKQILGEAAYDLEKFEYLGRITDSTYIAVASKKSGIKNLEDMKKKQGGVIGGQDSLSSSGGLGMFVASKDMGFNMKLVNAGKGTQDYILATIRGDVDWTQTPFESAKAAVIDSNDVVPLWIYAKERHPKLPDVPTVVELGYEQLLHTSSNHRVLATTPGTPPEVLSILRKAFQDAVNDEEFKKKLKETGNDGQSGDYELAQKISKSSLEQFASYEKILKENRK